MKKVLLTTTALVMTAGVASAEITFSGKGEAGVYRTAPTAAVAAVAGRHTDIANTIADDGTGAAAITAAEGNDELGFNADGVLTLKAATGDITDPDTSAAAADAIHTTGSLEEATVKLANALHLLREAEAALGDDLEADHNDENIDAVAIAKARVALAEAYLANIKGSAAVLKGATPKLKSYSGYDFNVAASGASDNGMTFAMGFDMGAGMIADQDDDRAMDAQAGAIDTSGLTIGYAGYTVVIGDEKVDDLYDDDGWNADVSISGSLGDLTFTLATDMDDDVKAVAASKVFTAGDGTIGEEAYTNATFVETEAVAAVYNPTSYAIGYTMGDIAFNMAGTEHDQFGNAAASMSLAYTVSDATTVTLSSDNLGTYKDVAKVTLKQKLSDAMTITASIKDDKDHALNTNKNKAQSSDISIAYTAGALSSTLATDEGSNWWVNAQYDLGGGATAFTTFDHTEFLVAGVNFAF